MAALAPALSGSLDINIWEDFQHRESDSDALSKDLTGLC